MEECDFVPVESFQHGSDRLGDLRIRRPSAGESWEKFLVGSFIVSAELIRKKAVDEKSSVKDKCLLK